jgi:hypothetical protein
MTEVEKAWHGLGPSAVILEDEGEEGFMPIAALSGSNVYLRQSDSLIVMTREVASKLAAYLLEGEEK